MSEFDNHVDAHNKYQTRMKEMGLRPNTISVERYYLGGYYCGAINSSHRPVGVPTDLEQAWYMGFEDAQGDRNAG